MKVLNERHVSDYFPMKFTCQEVKDTYGFSYDGNFCGSELEIEEEDLFKREWFKYPDYNGIDYGVFCPVCGSFVVVDVSSVPKCILEKCKDYKDRNDVIN